MIMTKTIILSLVVRSPCTMMRQSARNGRVDGTHGVEPLRLLGFLEFHGESDVSRRLPLKSYTQTQLAGATICLATLVLRNKGVLCNECEHIRTTRRQHRVGARDSVVVQDRPAPLSKEDVHVGPAAHGSQRCDEGGFQLTNNVIRSRHTCSSNATMAGRLNEEVQLLHNAE